jgi:hypothetical protein
MGSINYNFLADSLLFDAQQLEDNFANTAIKDLDSELGKYREFCIQTNAVLRSEISSDATSLNMFFDDPSASALQRAALYADKCVLEDPLVARSSKLVKQKGVEQILEGDRDVVLDKIKIANAARKMKENMPLVAANFLKYFPASLSFEGPDEIPILGSDDGFESALPEKILQQLKASADVTSLEMIDKGKFRVLKKNTPSRNISIDFDPLAFARQYGYVLFDSKLEIVDEQKRLVRAAMRLGDPPPEALYYKSWVKQSINQAARQFYLRGLAAAQLASSLNCAYSTRSNLLFSVLPRTTDAESMMTSRKADLFMNLEVPFLEGLSAQDLVRLRTDEGEAFTNFRVALDIKLQSLQELDDPEKANILAKQFLYEMNYGGANDLKNKLKSVKDKFAWNALLMTAGVVGCVQTGGLSFVASVLAAKGVGESVVEYRKDVKRHPAYLLWKMSKK